MGYRNLSQYKSIIVIKIIKKLHPIYLYNKFYKKTKGKMYQFSPLCVICHPYIYMGDIYIPPYVMVGFT